MINQLSDTIPSFSEVKKNGVQFSLAEAVGFYNFSCNCCHLLLPVPVCYDIPCLQKHQCKKVYITKHECNEEEVLHGKSTLM